MGYTKIALARRDAGLCIRCGTPRETAPGFTKDRCAECNRERNAQRKARYNRNKDAINANRRLSEQAIRAERQAQNRCKECGQPLDAQTVATRERCTKCRANNNVASNRRDRKKRLAERGESYLQDSPLHVGRNVAANNVRIMRVWLDKATYTCIQTLKSRERERRRAQAEADGITDSAEIARRTSLYCQVSRLLRETIKEYENRYDRVPYHTRLRSFHGKFHSEFAFGVDAETLAIIQHHSRERGGNLSWTICDLLCAATYPNDSTEPVQEKIQCNAPRKSNHC